MAVETVKGVLVLGGGGHAKVVIATLSASGIHVSAVYDDHQAKHGSELLGFRVVGPLAAASEKRGHPAIMAIGSNPVRKRLALDFSALPWAKAIHPDAVIDPTARIGDGTVVFAGAVIQADALVGRHVIVNTAATIDHDCDVGDFAHLAPGVHLAGGVRVDEGALLGIGAVATPGVKIGAWATVGAGAIVLNDVPPGVTVAGAPAREMK
ncbi:MAG: acetyltransferase [Acidobacteriota bacterium]